jgi:hypothetical protein
MSARTRAGSRFKRFLCFVFYLRYLPASPGVLVPQVETTELEVARREGNTQQASAKTEYFLTDNGLFTGSGHFAAFDSLPHIDGRSYAFVTSRLTYCPKITLSYQRLIVTIYFF